MGHEGHNQRRGEAIIEITEVTLQLLRDGEPNYNQEKYETIKGHETNQNLFFGLILLGQTVEREE